MNSKRKMFPSYTLLELLVVIAIFMILAGMGVGGFLGTRETMIARESVENIKQDIRTAKLKAMLLKKGDADNWVYGIGIDFEKYITESGANLASFIWCSPFEDFGNDVTKSEILNWDSTYDIGYGLSKVTPPLEPEPEPEPETPDETIPDSEITPPPGNITDPINPPLDVLGIADTGAANGYLPLSSSSSCTDAITSLIYGGGDIMSGVLLDSENTEIISNAKYLVFEAITGRAFLYDSDGKPLNYEANGDYVGADSSQLQVLDIVLKRRHSSKFDVISVYPLSGTLIHKVYSNADKGCSSVDGDVCIFVDGDYYFRYSIADEINSYR